MLLGAGAAPWGGEGEAGGDVGGDGGGVVVVVVVGGGGVVGAENTLTCS